MELQSHEWIYRLIVATIILMGCGTSGLFERAGEQVIKPLEDYQEPITRDLAQMLYPGFVQVREEVTAWYADQSLQFVQNSLQVLRVLGDAGYPSGYYLRMELVVSRRLDGEATFVREAERIGGNYFAPLLIALSGDWDRMFSAEITGAIVVLHWRSESSNQLTCVFDNQEIQSYLNGGITLQELVDKAWIEGRQDNEELGRIELNTLRREAAFLNIG